MQFRRGSKINLPAEAALGEPLLTLDTGELYVGSGPGAAPKKVSDVVTSATEPEVWQRDRLWVDPVSKTTKVFKDGSWQTLVSQANMDYGTF